MRTGLSVWGLPLALLLRNSCFALPVILDLYGAAGRLRWDEVKQIVRLMALHQLLKQEWLKDYQTLVLDEGAVFTLAKLHAFGRENTKAVSAKNGCRIFSSCGPAHWTSLSGLTRRIQFSPSGSALAIKLIE